MGLIVLISTVTQPTIDFILAENHRETVTFFPSQNPNFSFILINHASLQIKVTFRVVLQFPAVVNQYFVCVVQRHTYPIPKQTSNS